MANGIQKDLGKVTAYSYAKAAGYTGTEEQFQAIFNEFTENAPGLIGRMDTAVARAEAAVTNIDATVQDAVDDAVEEATASAVATANQAVTDAQAAQTAAEGAVTQANAAVTQANNAVTAAQAAQSAAEDAAESFVLDRTLTDSGAAAPADLVGNLKGSLTSLEGSKAVRYDTAQSLTAAQKIQVFSNIFGVNNNAGFHNSFFRGKSLGTSFSTAQHNAISAGTFDDMFIGDYWTIGGIDYVICHFDYYYRCTDSDNSYHHIVVMPRGVMTGLSVTKTSAETSDGYYQWNETSTTSGGYIASRMRTVIMPACDTKVKAAFGSSYVKTISELYPNGYDASTGRATGWAWASTDLACDLCNETMVYGAQVWSISSDGRPGYEVGIGKWQLAIFRLYPAFANTRAGWWLRSVSSATSAALVGRVGGAYRDGASGAAGVRPRFLVS